MKCRRRPRCWVAVRPESSSVPARLAGFATYAELLGAGLSRARIRTMVQRGELIKLSRGVYIASELADRMRILPAAD
ncbi:MAG: type IV toxin-antitoxin system AbiEi family antitoxin domain-containing protein, partial [Actinobacteria bacterium]|nr:type IV toxin-antitoxin system AbiEi family antitoxin domain-containing protein [Actinomycetota bacterium]